MNRSSRRPGPPKSTTKPTASTRGPSRKGLVIMYAIALLGLLAVFSGAFLNTSATNRRATEQIVWTSMARYAADAGVNYAEGIMSYWLRDEEGPFYNSFFQPNSGDSFPAAPPGPFQWMTPNGNGAEPAGVRFPLFPNQWQNAGAIGAPRAPVQAPGVPAAINGIEMQASRYRSEFSLQLAPGFTYQEIRDRMVGRTPGSRQSRFLLRSHGVVRGENLPGAPDGSGIAGPAYELLGSAVVYALMEVLPGGVCSHHGDDQIVTPRCSIRRVAYDLSARGQAGAGALAPDADGNGVGDFWAMTPH